ncbi:MAG: hypothetical protein U9P11_01500, partial [Pseudomonadota bacterium]|nr:hypothetical protein [Pseudomonadota bacterium]
LRKLYASIRDWLADWHTLGVVLIVATVILAGYVGYTAIKPHQWIFSVQAQSRIIELVTPANYETRWRINNAILCVRGKPELPVEKFVPIASGNPVCGGKHWSGYHIQDPEQTLVLTSTINAVLELRENKSLFLALRMHRSGAGNQTAEKAAATGDGKASRLPSAASLTFTDGSPGISLDQAGKLYVNIIFPAADSNTLAERVFPFTAKTTIGRDINWTGTSLLTEGVIEVYTADKSPDKRKRVDEAKLLLGDQLRLYPLTRNDRTVYPKGFIRLEPGKDYFDVIAFGAADHVRIERFGDNGYDFRPGLLLLLLNDQGLILVLSIFAALVGLVTGIASVCGKKGCS